MFTATVFRHSAFSTMVNGTDVLKTCTAPELELLKALAPFPIYMDVPIDLQGLPSPTSMRFVWQQQKRAVDQAFQALAPLADRLGACVARFLYLLSGNCKTQGNIWETYPAASLKLSGLKSEKYKPAKAIFDSDGWQGHDGEHRDGLAAVARGLGLQADHGTVLTGDDVDAVVCALVGVTDRRLEGRELDEEIRKRLADEGPWPPPRGYVLAASLPKGCRVEIYSRSPAQVLSGVKGLGGNAPPRDEPPDR